MGGELALLAGDVQHYLGKPVTESDTEDLEGPNLSAGVLVSSLIRVTFTLSSAIPYTMREKISSSTDSSRLR